MTAPILPENRWQGIWSPEPMERLVDGFAKAAATSGATSPLNDYAHVARALLPFLAWQNRAIAFNPDGIESLQRSALAESRELNRLVGTEQALDILATALSTRITLVYLPRPTRGRRTCVTRTWTWTSSSCPAKSSPRRCRSSCGTPSRCACPTPCNCGGSTSSR